jgi:glycoprotein 2-beta-D-xylosyltransferase
MLAANSSSIPSHRTRSKPIYTGRTLLITIVLAGTLACLIWNIMLVSMGSCIPPVNPDLADDPDLNTITARVIHIKSQVVAVQREPLAVPIKAAAVAAVGSDDVPAPLNQAKSIPIDQPIQLPLTVSQDSSLEAEYSYLKSAHELWSQKVKFPYRQPCAAAFGNAFNQRLPICRPNFRSANLSDFQCFHNKLTAATHCDLQNFLLDVNGVNSIAKGGEPIEEVRFQPEENEFLGYERGSFQFNCVAEAETVRSQNPEKLKELFPNHLETIISNSAFDAELQCEVFVENPTVLVTRYEFANLFHSLTLWYNIHQAQHMFNLHELSPNSTQFKQVDIIFLDAHSMSAMDPIWTALFHSVQYIGRFPKQRMCFRRALLIAPGYRSAIGVPMMHYNKPSCYNSCLLQHFSDNLLKKFGVRQLIQDQANQNKLIWAQSSTEPAEIVEIIDVFEEKQQIPLSPDTQLMIYIARRDYIAHPRSAKAQNVQRQLSNELEFVEACKLLAQNHTYKFLAVDFVNLSIKNQIALYHHAAVVVSVHGAGLAHLIFSNPLTFTVELRPVSYAGRDTFQKLAQWSRRNYARHSLNDRILHEENRIKVGVDVAVFAKRMENSLQQQATGNLPANAEFHLNLIEPIVLQYWPKFDLANSDRIDRDATEAELQHLEILRGLEQERGENSSTQRHKLCVIVPFRESSDRSSQGQNRTQNLMEFLPAIKRHLAAVGVEEHVLLIVEQESDQILFNKGALFNIGDHLALKYNFGCDYYALHDVDQVPESLENTYSFPEDLLPLHLCAATSAKDYRPAYPTMVGGALLITQRAFHQANGFSNQYWGWGHEDDDFYLRLMRVHGAVNRLTPEIGRYTALSHPRVEDLDITPVFELGAAKLALMGRENKEFLGQDGLNTLEFELRMHEIVQSGEYFADKFTVALQFPSMPRSVDDNEFLANSKYSKQA